MKKQLDPSYRGRHLCKSRNHKVHTADTAIDPGGLVVCVANCCDECEVLSGSISDL